MKELGINPTDYLKEARKTANARGYDGRALEFADDNIHKLMIWDDNGNPVKFGRVGYKDFIIYSMTQPELAYQKRKNYLARASKIRGDWKKDKFSPNSLAQAIIWAG